MRGTGTLPVLGFFLRQGYLEYTALIRGFFYFGL